MANGIREVYLEEDESGNYEKVEIVFGPHHILQIEEENEGLNFRLVSTHHGFKAGASGEVPTELEKIINSVRDDNPELKIDSID